MSDFRDYWYRSGDGLTLYARDYSCLADEAAGTVLCMHGLTRNSADFAGTARYLRQRYRVLVVDQRGRGRSAWDANAANYAPAVYVQDMFTLLDGIGLDEVILVGTSMGGLMSFLMLAMQPDRIRGTVINDVGPEIDPIGLARIQSYVGKSRPVQSWEEAVAQAREINAIAFPDFSEEEWWDFTRGLYRDDGGVPVLAYDPAIAGPMNDSDSGAVPPDLWPVFEAGNTRPMLVLRGASSDILAPACLEEMARRHPQLTAVTVPGRGHAPTLTEPTARAAIERFLEILEG